MKVFVATKSFSGVSAKSCDRKIEAFCVSNGQIKLRIESVS